MCLIFGYGIRLDAFGCPWAVERCTAGVSCRKWQPTTVNMATRHSRRPVQSKSTSWTCKATMQKPPCQATSQGNRKDRKGSEDAVFACVCQVCFICFLVSLRNCNYVHGAPCAWPNVWPQRSGQDGTGHVKVEQRIAECLVVSSRKA